MRFIKVLAAAALAALFVQAADMPSGASLIDRYIQKSGGAAAYAKAKTTIMTGTVTVTGANISGNVSIYQEGLKFYELVDIAGIGKIESGFDGETAWENSALQGPRILEGDEKIEAKRAAMLAVVSNWRQVFKEARTTGSEDLDGKPAWKVEMIAKEGKPETFYFDKDSGLLVKTTSVRTTPLGNIPAESDMSDFRPVNGIITPFTLTEKAMNQNMVLKFSAVSYNSEMPKDRFALPPEIKAVKK
jgi:zinc protease